MIDFARSESNSSFESEGLGAARGNADDAEDYEIDEYGAFKDDFRPASAFPLKVHIWISLSPFFFLNSNS